MKIKYAFLDGTVTEVEVSDEIGAVIIDSRKAEHAQDERHRYHCYSYDAIDYEGEEYGACDEYAVEDDSAEQTARIREAFSHLTATQQRRLRLYANGKALREIAAIEEARWFFSSTTALGGLHCTACRQQLLGTEPPCCPTAPLPQARLLPQHPMP